MIGKCPFCGKSLELGDELQEGQHILCPYCNKKFVFNRRPESPKPTRVSVPQRTVEPKGAGRGYMLWRIFKAFICTVLWLLWVGSLLARFVDAPATDTVVGSMLSIRAILLFFLAAWFSKNCVD